MHSRLHSKGWIPFRNSRDGETGRIPRSPVLTVVLGHIAPLAPRLGTLEPGADGNLGQHSH